jgi:uridine kinase
VNTSPIIIFEGILSLYDIRIREIMDVKIFVLTEDDIRLSRRCILSHAFHTYPYSAERLFRAWPYSVRSAPPVQSICEESL